MKFEKSLPNHDIEETPKKVESSLGEKPLYFKNVGLFSENFLMHHLDNSKDVYIMQNWETEDLPAFNACYEWMLSTWAERKDEFEHMKEAQLEEEWIKPILQRLGWDYIVQPGLLKHGKRQIPDYALFDSPAAKKKAIGADPDKLFDISAVVADAKAMRVDLDGDSLDNSNPSYQIIQYMSYTGKDWGILTNGRYWRLYSTKAKTRFRAYFEINLDKLLNSNTREDKRFKYFFNFFRKEAFSAQAGALSFVDYTFNVGQQYAVDVEKELKTRVFDLVEKISKGFISESRKLKENELEEIYRHSLYFTFRLIFILNCEAKGLLNIGRQDAYFPYSLRSLCMRLREEMTANPKWSNQPISYNYISSLFKLLAAGDKEIGVHGFGNEVFESGIRSFYKDRSISDKTLNDVLVNLACRFDKKAKDWKFIDYERLSIDHLGSLFEGLLEYKLAYEGNEVILLNSSGERKASGSYYTPDYLVDHVVKETLTPLVKNKTVKEILKLKVYDPTMGSGHFLLGAVKFLEEAVIEQIAEEKEQTVSLASVRKEVLKNCVVGTDLNPLAVELAKFSLWMFSCQKTDSLEGLDKQLHHADSLVPRAKMYDSGFVDDMHVDAVVGNPPWDKIKFDEEEFFRGFSEELNSKKVSKTKKQEIYTKLLANKEIKAKYESAKQSVENRLSAIESAYYAHQKNESEKQSRFIDHNLYKLAIERFFRLLNPEGRLGVVLPTGVLGDLGCSNIRKFMFQSNRIETIVGFAKDAKVFEISQAVAFIIANNGGTTKEFKYVDNLDSDDFSKINKIVSAAPKIKWTLVTQLDKDTLTIPFVQNDLALSIIEKMYEKVQGNSGLKLDMGRELHQTDDDKYLVDTKKKVRVVKGDEIDHFVTRPNGKQYLNSDGEIKHASKISDRPKLAIRAISGLTDPRRLVAAIIPDRMLTVNSLLVAKTALSDEEMLFALAFLNSRAIEYRFRQISKNNNVNKFALDMLPIPKFESKLKGHQAIVALSKRISSGGTAKIADELDDAVMDIYDFNKSEREFLKAEISAIDFATKISKRKAA